MGQKFEYAVASFRTESKSSDKGCVDDLSEMTNKMGNQGFRLVSSVYESRVKVTFLFFERRIGDE